MVGPLTRQYVQQVHFSKAFIGIDGWQPETGFTGRDMMRSDVVNAVLEKSVKPLCSPTALNLAPFTLTRWVPLHALAA
jgi:DeoR/GlpR family transcriptional regulator of sugar metabolism